MRSAVGISGLILAAVALVGCTAMEPKACTAIGSVPGVGVTIDKAAATGVDGLRLEVCWKGDPCRDAEVELQPGTDTVDQGCDGDDPDSTCSASAVPNGTLVGFAQIEGLPSGPIDVTAIVIKGTKPQPESKATVMAAVTHPNGPDCPAGANQAKITIDADGIR
ncbi:hypothetical protein [Microlunatus sp. GCM10028923]|uniref:hypothetical protein n=1 Tax=Microlunatus sp. GCM10028923 TaxID=3273400 RepID=UPI00361D55DD